MLWNFFNNLSWSSKFYFVQFNHNSRPIEFEFLVNDEIKRMRTEIKKTSNMDDVWSIVGTSKR